MAILALAAFRKGAAKRESDGAGDEIVCTSEGGAAAALSYSPTTEFFARIGAGDETRTRDVLLGKEVLYH
jgi:hypothetical protein